MTKILLSGNYRQPGRRWTGVPAQDSDGTEDRLGARRLRRREAEGGRWRTREPLEMAWLLLPPLSPPTGGNGKCSRPRSLRSSSPSPGREPLPVGRCLPLQGPQPSLVRPLGRDPLARSEVSKPAPRTSRARRGEPGAPEHAAGILRPEGQLPGRAGCHWRLHRGGAPNEGLAPSDPSRTRETSGSTGYPRSGSPPKHSEGLGTGRNALLSRLPGKAASEL